MTRTSGKPFVSMEKQGKNRAGGKVLPTPDRPNRNPNDGGPGMAAKANITARGDSTSGGQNESTNWKSIGSLAAALAGKAVRA